ncbi:MAG TPA: hypothetical protein DD670_18075, partial [Planctomycetaceae bacterium]|nr:hypothetical protein [Planctomycetaceae bacterium]
MGRIQFHNHKILFVNNKVAMDPACCCVQSECPCGCCSESEPPCCFLVTIGGMANAGGCLNCDDYNQTRLLVHTGPCTWTGPSTGGYPCCTGYCGLPAMTLTIAKNASDHYILTVTLGGHAWQHDFGASKPDCGRISGLSLSHTTNGTVCDSSSASCSVSAANGCPDPGDPCRYWFLDHVPDTLTATVSHFGNATCSDCTSLNGAYVLTRVGTTCAWEYTFPTPICTVDRIRFSFWCETSTECAPCHGRFSMRGTTYPYEKAWSEIWPMSNCWLDWQFTASGVLLDYLVALTYPFEKW